MPTFLAAKLLLDIVVTSNAILFTTTPSLFSAVQSALKSSLVCLLSSQQSSLTLSPVYLPHPLIPSPSFLILSLLASLLSSLLHALLPTKYAVFSFSPMAFLLQKDSFLSPSSH